MRSPQIDKGLRMQLDFRKQRQIARVFFYALAATFVSIGIGVRLS
jgi:hypothetical protein